MNDAPELWDTSDIAEYLRKPRSTIQRHLIHQPGFPDPVKGSGKPLLFRKDRVLAFIFNQADPQSQKPTPGSKSARF